MFHDRICFTTGFVSRPDLFHDRICFTTRFVSRPDLFHEITAWLRGALVYAGAYTCVGVCLCASVARYLYAQYTSYLESL